MKTPIHSKHVLFTILFFVLVFQGYTQDKVEQYNSNGLITTIFNTKYGNITVYMPEHGPNQTISISAFMKSMHDTAKAIKKDVEVLKNFQLLYGNKAISLQSNTSTFIAPNTANSTLQLLNKKGKLIAKVPFSSNLSSSNQVSANVPTYMVSGETVMITAKCDGNLLNNKVTINNTDISILAESESGVFFIAPTELNGRAQIQFTNEDETVESTVNILGLDLAVGSTNLLRGETTNLSIDVSGLDGLESDVPITITNNSTSNIKLEGGNVQQLLINPASDAASGDYSKSLSIRALQRGGFSISVKVEPPQSDESLTNSELLCSCWLNSQTYLISPEACEELGGSCSEDNLVADYKEDMSAPNFSFKTPYIISADDNKINFQIRDYNQDDCIAAVFSYRPINTQDWKIIGFDNTHLDGLSVLWNVPANEDGIIEIQAQVVNKNNIIFKKTTQVYLITATVQLNNENQDVSYTILDSDIKRALDKARRAGDAIDDLEDEIYDKWGKRQDAEDRKKDNEDGQNELITIDKVLDSIPKTYKDELENILESIANLKKKLPETIDDDALLEAIANAQSRVDDCEDRLAKLKKEQQDLKEENDRIREETDAALEELDAIMKANGMKGSYGYHPDGRYWYGYIGDESANEDYMYSEEYYQLKGKLRGLKKQHLKTQKRLGEMPDEIAEAEKDCEELNAALEKAKTAKENADSLAVAQLEAEDICRQIRRLLIPLWRWCLNNQEDCDFKDEINELLKRCPKDVSELDDFWNDFKDLVKRKKEQEDDFGKAADDNQKEIDDIDDDISGLEDDIKGLEDRQRKEYEAADQLRKQRAAEAAAAKARADARAKERRKQKKEDDKIKDLIKKAKSGDTGDEAFENLLKGLVLDRLDNATGNVKLGKIIGGLLVIKGQPDCVCPLLEALLNAIKAKKDGKYIGVYVEGYIQVWNKCANLSNILASVSMGGTELTEAINNMSKAQIERAMEALNRAIRIQCK